MIIDTLKEQYIDSIDEINKLSFSDGWNRNLIELDMTNPNSYYVVAVDNDRAVAYGGITVIAGEANVTNIATHPERRREGIGALLLDKLIEYCKANTLLLITLEVRKSNIPAISLYSSKGFSVEGERKRYYSDNGEDALIMTLRF